jgi:hypothetical protein
VNTVGVFCWAVSRYGNYNIKLIPDVDLGSRLDATRERGEIRVLLKMVDELREAEFLHDCTDGNSLDVR